MNPAPATKPARARPAMRTARAARTAGAALRVNARPAKLVRQTAIARTDEKECQNRRRRPGTPPCPTKQVSRYGTMRSWAETVIGMLT